MWSPRLIFGVLSIAILVFAWWVLSGLLRLIPASSFPTIPAAYEAFSQVLTVGYADARLVEHCVHSLGLIAVGFSLACAVAVPLGVAMAALPGVGSLLNPVFLLLRPIPPLAWIPLAIIWLGLGDAAKILVIICGAFPPALINTMAGVKGIDRQLIDAARMLGTPPLRYAAKVLLPAALPSIFTGLRTSLQATWTTLVAAELVGALAGLGQILNAAQQDIYPAMVLIGMIAVAVLGWATTALLAVVERLLVRARFGAAAS